MAEWKVSGDTAAIVAAQLTQSAIAIRATKGFGDRVSNDVEGYVFKTYEMFLAKLASDDGADGS